jgi:hypothetical protein
MIHPVEIYVLYMGDFPGPEEMNNTWQENNTYRNNG